MKLLLMRTTGTEGYTAGHLLIEGLHECCTLEDEVRAVKLQEPQLESGRCSYCGKETPGRWCDIFCRDDWAKQQDADKRAGR